ncbi:hypothetical protein OIU79_008386 [Salix purpurea]|uniref:Uncharacterized protein n=1 Tax=Salix purpurea TaxID=77065 RepID=A0A9Q0TI93_SALPP|nr:hypothetical protein OIU79_008386 [Salix purpurea]
MRTFITSSNVNFLDGYVRVRAKSQSLGASSASLWIGTVVECQCRVRSSHEHPKWGWIWKRVRGNLCSGYTQLEDQFLLLKYQIEMNFRKTS